MQGDADQREIFLKPCSSASHWSFAFQWAESVHWLMSSTRRPQTHNMMSAHQKYKHTVCACTEKSRMYPWADRTFSKHERTKWDFLDLLLVQNINKKKNLDPWPPGSETDGLIFFFFSFFKVQIIPEIHLVDRSRQTIRAIKQKASLNGRTVQENPDLDISVREHGERMMGSFQGHLANPPGIDKPRSEEFTLNRRSVLGI